VRTTWTRGPILGTPHVLGAAVASSTARWTTVAQPPYRLHLFRSTKYCDFCWPDPEEWQGGFPGQRLPYPIRVIVLKPGDRPLEGAWVRISAVGDGAVLDSALTNSNGYAWVNPVLGPQTGVQEFTMYVLGTETDERIHAFAHPETPVLHASISPSVNRPGISNGVHVRVTNTAGTPIAGYPVRAFTHDGSRIFAPAIRTGPNGTFSFEWIYSQLGVQRVTLTAGPAQLELAGEASNSWMIPNLKPNQVLTPTTYVQVHTSYGYLPPDRNPMYPGPSEPYVPQISMDATVYGRTRALTQGPPPGGTSLYGFYWGLLDSRNWLSGLPDGPAVVRFRLHLSNGEVWVREVPVIIHNPP
jgi:hypothetical protein